MSYILKVLKDYSIEYHPITKIYNKTIKPHQNAVDNNVL
jgi:hypothetical protein